MINPFKSLSFLSDAPEEETPEAIEKREKAERVKFHRDHVRNGPRSFGTVTSGQFRRRLGREQKARLKKARRDQVRTYFETQRKIAVIRGHLQSAGVLESGLGGYPDIAGNEFVANRAAHSYHWLVDNFWEWEDGEGHTGAALLRALNTYQELVGIEKTGLPAHLA